MAVNETLSAYSTTAASNTPAGTDSVGPDLDNHLRDIKKNVKVAVTNWYADTPENVAGSWMVDLSATPVGSINFQDGTDVIKVFDFDQSANTVTLPAANLAGGAAGKDILSRTATSSARAILGFGDYTLDAADSTASARTSLGLGTAALLNSGTSVGNLPDLISGSATSIAALPVVSGEFLTNVTAHSQSYYSGAQTLTYDATLNIPAATHGITGNKFERIVRLWGVCNDVGGDAGYAQNDVINFPEQGGSDFGWTAKWDAGDNDLDIVIGAGIRAKNPSTFNDVTLTASKWNLHILVTAP